MGEEYRQSVSNYMQMGQASRQYIFNYGKIQVNLFDYLLNTCHICLGLLDQIIMRNRMLFFFRSSTFASLRGHIKYIAEMLLGRKGRREILMNKEHYALLHI